MFDMKHLTRLKKLDEKALEAMKGFWAFGITFDSQRVKLLGVASNVFCRTSGRGE
jgi:hypothetical protein